jgi:hypothetical protein
MPINPVTNTLANVGDKVTALWNGDQGAIISLSGSFQNMLLVLEVLPFGQTQFIPIADVNVQTGQLQQATQLQVTPLSNQGPGGGYILKLRVVQAGSGAITGVIASLPFPVTGGGAALTTITGTVSIVGQTFATADAQPAASVPETAIGITSGAGAGGPNAVVSRLREDPSATPGTVLVGNPDERQGLEKLLLLMGRVFIATCEANNLDQAGIEGQWGMDEIQALMG